MAALFLWEDLKTVSLFPVNVIIGVPCIYELGAKEMCLKESNGINLSIFIRSIFS